MKTMAFNHHFEPGPTRARRRRQPVFRRTKRLPRPDGGRLMTVTNVLVSRRRAKFVVLLVLCIGLGFSRGSSAQSFLNAQRSGGTGADAGQAIAADAAGNTYVTGFFSDAVSFGATESRFSPSSDMFLAKYDPNGGLVWLQQAIGGDGSAGWGVAVDSAQNVYVTGGFGAGGTGGSAIFPDLPHAYTRGDPQHTIHTVQTTDAGFVAKYDSAGTLQWVRSIGDSTLGFAIAVQQRNRCGVCHGQFHI